MISQLNLQSYRSSLVLIRKGARNFRSAFGGRWSVVGGQSGARKDLWKNQTQTT